MKALPWISLGVSVILIGVVIYFAVSSDDKKKVTEASEETE